MVEIILNKTAFYTILLNMGLIVFPRTDNYRDFFCLLRLDPNID